MRASIGILRFQICRICFAYPQSATGIIALLFLITTTQLRAQNVLTNGAAHDGAISVAAETDTWTIAATQGDRISVEIAELSGGAGFVPRIELFAPDGSGLGVDSDGVAGRLDIQAHTSGTFSMTVRDFNQTGTGTYRLRLAQVPGAFVVPVSDEGGAMVNGTNHQGTIDLGDLDMWTIPANSGDRITVQISELSGGASFTPLIELFAPNGALLGIQSGGTAARLDAQAAVAGTYTMLVSDLNQTGSGTYQLQLAQTPRAFVIPAGDEGGVLTNAINQDGAITLGDLDLWTFDVTNGELVTIQVTELSGGATFTPQLELFAPNGERKFVTNNATTATLVRAIENGGAYRLLVSDSTQIGAGTYRLNFTRGLIAPPTASFLTNGSTYQGSIGSVGSSNLYNFTATAGESIALRAGNLNSTDTLDPWIQLYSPTGALLASEAFNAGSKVQDIHVRATNSGTFTVVVRDGNIGAVGTGPYRLTLAKSDTPIVISPADEGGTLTNGTTHTGTIDLGDLDTWSFTANMGEGFVVRMGNLVAGDSLDPWIRLFGPDGTLLGSQSFNAGTKAQEVSGQATVSGTYTVVVGDGNIGLGGTGGYLLTLAKTGVPLVISPSDDGGAIINGTTHTGAIDLGDLDTWSFIANAGEGIVVRMGNLNVGDTLDPWIRLYSPNGVLLASQSFNAGTKAQEISVQATNSGTFTVVASDGNLGFVGTGPYRLTLAKTGTAILISPSDDGGPMTNATTHTGTIDLGDIDTWSFSASVGEGIVLRMGNLNVSDTLDPWIRLYSPSGTLLASQAFNAGSKAQDISVQATNSGKFTVVVGDGNLGFVGIGTYRLTLAKTGSPIVISPSDEGGPMINATTHTGTIDLGDIDTWSFSANTGEGIVVRMGNLIASDALDPWIRLYSPNGTLLATETFNAGTKVQDVAVQATISGTFTVVVGDGNLALGGIGTYRLTLAKTGTPIVISPGDEGGSMTNGSTHTGTIELGDIDAWSFTANAGDGILLRMGNLNTGDGLDPWIRLYSPSGTLLASASYNDGVKVQEISVQAPSSGTFMVVAGDGNLALGEVGEYRLTLAKTGEPIVVTPGDEGGEMSGTNTYDGTIDVGDLDAFSFNICAGEPISLRVDELVGGSTLTPSIRLYGRDGALLNTASGAATAQINRTAPTNGTYTVIIGNSTLNSNGAGTYRLTVNGLSEQLKFCRPIVLSGTNLNLQAVGGIPNASYVLFTHTNVGAPFGVWSPILTNQFDQFGVFSRTNPLIRTEPERYFRFIQQ